MPNCQQYCRGQCCSHHWTNTGSGGNYAVGNHKNTGSNSISAGPRNPMGQSKGEPRNPRGKPTNPMGQQGGNSGSPSVKMEKVPFDDLSDLFPITKVEFPDVFGDSNKKDPKNDRVAKSGSDSGEMPGNEVAGQDDSDNAETDSKMSGLIFPDFGSDSDDSDPGKRLGSELELDHKRDKSYFELEDSVAY